MKRWANHEAHEAHEAHEGYDLGVFKSRLKNNLPVLRALRTTMIESLRGSRKLRCNFEIECYMQSEFLTTKHTKATKNGKRIIIKMRSALI